MGGPGLSPASEPTGLGQTGDGPARRLPRLRAALPWLPLPLASAVVGMNVNAGRNRKAKNLVQDLESTTGRVFNLLTVSARMG